METKNTNHNIKDDYLSQIYEHFHQKKEVLIGKNVVTPANIYNLFNRIDVTELDNNDAKIYRDFVERRAAINSVTFKPVANFLKGLTNNIREENTADLLALLIDFKPRPKKLFLSSGNTNVEDFEISAQETLKPIDLQDDKSDNQLDDTVEFLTLKDHKMIKKILYSLSFLLIVSLLVYIFTSILSWIHNRDNFTINTKNFNINNNYYYYKEKDKIKLIDKQEAEHRKDKKAQPVTPIVLDEYFYQQGMDTTQPEVKAIKINYFKQHTTPEIINVDTGQPVNAKQNKQVEVKKVIKVANKTDKKVKVKADNKGIIGEILPDKIYQKYIISEQDHFSYRPSQKFKNQTICDYDLDYEIKRDGQIQKQHLSISAAGFSKQSAKNNAQNKMRLLLKEELKNLAL